MPKPFDATLNALIDAHLADWAAFLAARVGVPPGPATPLDTDLSATLQADRLFRVDGAVPYALHLELESTGRLGIPFELLRYSVAAHAATGLPVHSVLVLLRPKANATDQTGTFERPGADGRPIHTFRYTVVRVWQESVEGLLSAGLGFAPLALLTNEAAADLPGVFDRLRPPAVPGKVGTELLSSTLWLAGLRYREEQFVDLYRRASMVYLEDNAVYHWMRKKAIAEGMALSTQALILRLGTKRFRSPPPAPVETALRAVTDPDRLERIADRLLDAAGWEALLEAD